MKAILLARGSAILIGMALLGGARLAFAQSTDAAHPTEKAVGPANLDFEEGELDKVPDKWAAPAPGYKAQLTDRQPKSGKCCALITRNAGEPGQGFGYLMQHFDAAPYRGKKVCLRAAVRVEAASPGSRAQLWLRVDCRNGKLGFFDNMNDRPILNRAWREYEIVGDVAEDAERIAIGMVLAGDGKAWLDAVSFKVMGEAGEGNEPPRPLEPRAATNLIAFAKLFGYVRYFHPSDEAAATNWEQFAIDGIKAVEDAKDSAELAARLDKLMQPIASSVRVYVQGEPPPERATANDSHTGKFVFWHHFGVGTGGPGNPQPVYSSARISNEEIAALPAEKRSDAPLPDPAKPLTLDMGGGVACRLPLALYVDDKGTLPRATAARPASSKPAGFRPSGNDRATRLAAIVIAWNVFQHFYPYFDEVKADWPAELQRGLTRAATDADEQAFLATLRLLVAALEDGHGNVIPPGDTSGGAFFPPFQWAWIENQLVVAKVAQRDSGGLKPGDVVLKIGGRPAAEAIADQERFTCGATPQFKRDSALLTLARGEKDSEIAIDVADPNGGTHTVRVRRTLDLAALQALGTRREVVEEIEYGIIYVDLGRITEKQFQEAVDKLAKAKGIVFDLREYPNVSPAPIAHLIDSPVSSPQWRIPVTLYPDRQDVAYPPMDWRVEPKAPRFQAKVAFLCSARNISYAETLLGIIEHYKLAAIVGSPTAGTNGNVNTFALPGGYRVVWTGMKVLKQDGSRHHGVGVQPTVLIAPTIAGVAQGRDEVLERAIKVVRP